MKLLIIEDEPKVAAFLKQGLEEDNWRVWLACDGEQALTLLRSFVFDVIILDIMLPRLDGFAVLRTMRSEGIHTPVLILTARDAVPDRVKGLNYGADDYLVKPFAFEELVARLHALVRRPAGYDTNILQVDDLEMDIDRRIVRRAGVTIPLTTSEFRLLELLMRNKGRVLDRLTIEENVWDINYDRNTNIVDVYINHLRKKIDKPFGRAVIHTVRGFGYKLEALDED